MHVVYVYVFSYIYTHIYIYIYNSSVQLLQEVKLRKIGHKISFALLYIYESIVFYPHPNISSSSVKYGADYVYLPNEMGN